MAIPADEESDSELVIEEQAKETSQASAGMGPAAKTTRANTSAIPMEADVQLAMEIEQQEDVVEAAQAMEISVAA